MVNLSLPLLLVEMVAIVDILEWVTVDSIIKQEKIMHHDHKITSFGNRTGVNLETRVIECTYVHLHIHHRFFLT